MKFTEEQLLLQKAARDFAENEVRPRIDEIIENEGYIPRDLYKRMGELGFYGMMVDKQFGGGGMGMTEVCLVTEELSKVAPTMGLILMCVAPGIKGFELSPIFRERYLEGCMNGDLVVSGAVTAPEGHTNVPEWSIFAKKVDGGYLLNGTKCFCTSACDTDFHYVYGLDEDRHMRIFCIDGDAKGFNHDAHEIKFGMKGSGGGTCTYQDVFCPDELVFDGEVGDGTFYFLIWVQCATIALGAAEGVLEMAMNYANTRTNNFKPVAAIGAQAERIANLKVKALAARALIYDACFDLEDESTLQEGYLKTMAAKVFVPDMAYEITMESVTLHGGLGYSDVHIYHFFADALAAMIMDQTTEYILEGIAHYIGLPEELY